MTYQKFKGTKNQYVALHNWVKRNLARPDSCKLCGKISDKTFDWANISNGYKRELNDWMYVCRSCHKRYDLTGKPDECVNGHKMTVDNTYTYPNGCIECRTCRRVHKIEERVRIRERIEKGE